MPPFSMVDELRLPYRLFSPKLTHDEKAPLILYLHGAGGRGVNNLNQLENIVQHITDEIFQTKHPSYVLIPQCPSGHQWVDIPNDKLPYQNYNQDSIPEGIYQQMVFKLLQQLASTETIDKNRIYVIGFSMGATGTWDIITRHPEVFAAAVILSGRSDPSKATRVKNLPIWQFHGRFDRISPISNSEIMIVKLQKVHGNVTFTKLFWGHGIPRFALKNENLFPWLFEQHNTSSLINTNNTQ